MTDRTAIRAAVALGLILRLAAFLPDRSLWADEAMLALNVIDRSAGQLVEPLDRNQGAPVGYLLLLKACVARFGPTEHAFRFVSFVASVGGVCGFAAVARRVFPGRSAAFAVGLFAVNPAAVSYAGEAKPYALDAAVAVGLLLLSVGGPTDGKPFLPRSGLRRFAVAGAVAVWFSHPAVFVLAGVGLGLFANRPWRHVSAVVAVWLASFAACYWFTLRAVSANRYLAEYWAPHFLPGTVDPNWLWDHLLGLFDHPGGFDGIPGASAVGLSLAGAGAVALTRTAFPIAVAAVAPAVAALVASGFGRYPFAGRLLLFLVPGLCLLVARGVAGPSPIPRTVRAAFAAALLALPTARAVEEIRRPSRQEEIVLVLKFVRDHRDPGDRVYVYYGAKPAVDFYAPLLATDTPSIVFGGEHRNEPEAYLRELDGVSDRRVWVIASHRHPGEVGVILEYLKTTRRPVMEYHVPGAAAYLFQSR